VAKVSILVLADTETHGDMGRVANALETVKELKGANADVELIFDGAGTKWVRELSKTEHRMKPLFDGVKDKVAGACEFCARAYGVKDAVRAAGVPLLSEFDEHPSIARRIAQGAQVITF
jgi:hypothetical protein